ESATSTQRSAIKESRPSPETLSGRLVSVRRKALATATLGRRLRIAERELLVQTLLQEVHLGPVDQLQAVGIDKDAHPVLLEHRVPGPLIARQVNRIAPARTAGAAHAKAQTHGIGCRSEIALHAFKGGRSKSDGHGVDCTPKGGYAR